MYSLEGYRGFSTLQGTVAMLVAAIFTGAALKALPEIMDSAEWQVTRYAASTETMHQAVWNTYTKASTITEADIPPPMRIGFEVHNDLVHSPLGSYCFSTNDPANTLDHCQTLTAE